MARPLVWPGKYFFYPIGNTSAVCLTRDIAIEEHANILLLGCGDPRNILYTIFCEPVSVRRKLDFTCCDFEPAVLARNVLLLAMIIDKKQDTSAIWNTFFHIQLDKRSLSVLVEQCKKLIAVSDSLQSWNASPYGRYLKMSTEYTLTELRRHWLLYTEMHGLSAERLKKIRSAFTVLINSMSKSFVTTASRSAGPLSIEASPVVAEQFKNYWKKSVTFLDSGQVGNANLLNPTFFYSLAGEGCNVHYGTDPIAPFHLAELFGNTKRTPSVGDLVRAAQNQFHQWSSAFHAAITSLPPALCPVIRFFLGEAMAVCRSLRIFSETGKASTTIPVAQWKIQTITLSTEADGYGGGPSSAPATFDVIDTSNLCDHIGLLNVLIASVPVLRSTWPSSGVLYTESLLFRGQDATKEFAERLYGDITVIGLLIGLCPVDYVSGFNARSNIHELLSHQSGQKNKVSAQLGMGQFQQVTTWRKASSGDVVSGGLSANLLYSFDPWQLGTFLYDMYHRLFEQEDAKHFWRINANNVTRAVSQSNVVVYYTRESFVLFLKLMRDHLCIPSETWFKVMDRFFEVDEADNSLPMDANNKHDLWAHLNHNGLYTTPIYQLPPQKVGLFSTWDSVPVLVRVVLSVPRDKLSILFGPEVGTPLLLCDIGGVWSHNAFSSLHVAFGRVIPAGTDSNPHVIFEEDPQGRQGSSPLVVSFIMPTIVLTQLEPQTNLEVSLGLRSSPGSISFVEQLGPMLRIFSAKLLDKSHVHILPEQPLTPNKSYIRSSRLTTGEVNLKRDIGKCEDVVVSLDQDCELVASMTCRLWVQEEQLAQIFADRSTTVSTTQISPCTMRVAIGSYSQDVVYPFPVIGNQYKLRLARKSKYIEVVVPPFGPTKSDGMKLNLFPTVGVSRNLTPWNIHRVNLSRLPVINIKSPRIDKWLNHLSSLQMSSRERSLRRHHEHDKDTLMAVKDTLHTIIVRSAGIQNGPARRLFALRDKGTNNCDTIFFINVMKYDLACHTVICDGYVLPLTVSLLMKIQNPFGKLVHEGDLVNITTFDGEMRAWKQLLPAMTERCRSSWMHGANCEYTSKGIIPLTEEMETDPLCSCGRGKEVEGMYKVNLWKDFAPYVTRIALCPLFAVSYLETVGRDPAAHRCSVCRQKGKPKIKICTGCKKVRYCSEACQKKDWKKHKKVCKA